MTAYPIVYQTSTGKIVRKTSNNDVVFKDGTFTLNEKGINPRVMLQYSDDGGFTWSNEYWRTVGKIGKFKDGVDFNRMGMSQDRVFRITVTDPVKWVITGARIDVESEK